ncbi:MAG: tetratricopeptide repeat protein, partial [Blastocatellia bacterium]|nr:tetratricopeptide repeat protein [Blastocatellia bacterium]
MIFVIVGALSFALIGSIVTDILKYSNGGQPDGLWLIFAFIITSIALLVYISYVIKLFRARSVARKKLRAQDSAPLYPDQRQNPHWKRIRQLNEIRKTIRQAKVRIEGWDPEKFWEKLGGALFLGLDEKQKIAEELKKMTAEELAELIRTLDRQAVRYSRKLGEDLFASVSEAICGGRLANYADIEGADAEALRTGNQSLRVIARLARQDGRNQVSLLKEVEKILPHIRSPHVWLLWANRIKKLPGSQKKLEWAYPQMKTLGGHDANSWNDYANLLVERLAGVDEAEAAYYLAIELDPKFALPWHNLGKLLKDRRRYDEAEQALRKALEINPQYASAWKSLGSLLQHNKLNRIPEAAGAYRRAIELEPNDANTWNEYGTLLIDKLKKPAEAEKAYRRAVKLDPNNASYLNNLAWQLYLNNKGLDEAEQYARRSVNVGTEKKENYLINIHTLACILMRRGIWLEAVKYAHDFIRQGNDGLHKEAWPEIIMFFRDAVATGHANEALQLIDEAQCGEHWKPMREALQAISRDDASYLTFLAPEIRQPVEKLLANLLPSGVALSTSPKIRQKQRAERAERKSYNFQADIKLFVPNQP